MRLLLLALVLVGCAGTPAPAPAAPATPSFPEPAPPALRLPDTVRPVRYRLELRLVPAEPTFSGTVMAELDVRTPVRQVWLHAQDLTVSAARVRAGARTLEARIVTADGGRLGVLLAEELPAGPAQLSLDFTGKPDRERSQGLYTVEEDGEPYAYTFFEPIDARRAFPSFDDPGFKVPWTLAFTVKQAHTALANAAIASEEPLPDGMKRVTFRESKPMPSYLVAFVVGPFDVVEAGTVGRAGVPLRFVVPRGRGPETAFAASVTPRLVTALEDFFDQTYPYEKLDVAVVPRFWGTMEHPGLVALGQPLTLIRPGEETPARRERYVHIALHELGHYWFGNVVTCRWWDDIWLNESLTSWLDGRTVQAVAPEWDFQLEAQADARDAAIAADTLASALPVRKPVESNGDIEGSFDTATTYSKGAALLNMLEGWVGAERLRDAMRVHVRKHAWGVVTADDFITVLSEGLGPEPAASFRGFIERAGVPRVTAELACSAGAPPRLRLAQERYLPAGSPGAQARTWTLPVCVRAAGGERVCRVLDGASGELTLPGRSCPAWVLLNAGGSGYYVSGYTPAQLRALLKARSLAPAERLALLSDVEAGVERGDLAVGDALALVPATAQDPSRLVLERGAALLGLARADLLPEPDRARMRAWLRKLYGPRARALGWSPRPGEPDDARQLRVTLLNLAADGGEDPALVREAQRVARASLRDRTTVSADVAPLALTVAARAGDAALFDAVFAAARATKDRTERGRLVAALGAFREPGLAARARALVLGSELDRRETAGILHAQLSDARTRGAAWAWLLEHFGTLARGMRSDEAGGLLARVGVLCDAGALAQAEARLGPQAERVEDGPRRLRRALEQVRVCATQREALAPQAQQFLRALGAPAPSVRGR